MKLGDFALTITYWNLAAFIARSGFRCDNSLVFVRYWCTSSYYIDIKGIEIILLYRKANYTMRFPLGLVGEKFQIIEIWDIQCQPPGGRLGLNGVANITVAFWFMVTSTYVEFCLGERFDIEKVIWEKFEDNTKKLTEIEPGNTTAGETDFRLQWIWEAVIVNVASILQCFLWFYCLNSLFRIK